MIREPRLSAADLDAVARAFGADTRRDVMEILVRYGWESDWWPQRFYQLRPRKVGRELSLFVGQREEGGADVEVTARLRVPQAQLSGGGKELKERLLALIAEGGGGRGKRERRGCDHRPDATSAPQLTDVARSVGA